MQQSNLLIICHEQSDYSNLSQILQHYFPPQSQIKTQLINQINCIDIVNKYYKAKVKLSYKLWNNVLDYQSLSNQMTKENNQLTQQTQNNQEQQLKQIQQVQQNDIKYDLMIMLVNKNQQSTINYQLLDQIIQKFNPQQFVLLYNTEQPEQSWIHQSTIIQKCNNFFQIVKQNLLHINKTKPNWSRGALLHNQQQNLDSGIFSILDRIQTTRWTTMINVKKDNQKTKFYTQNLFNTKNQTIKIQNDKINTETKLINPQTKNTFKQQQDSKLTNQLKEQQNNNQNLSNKQSLKQKELVNNVKQIKQNKEINQNKISKKKVHDCCSSSQQQGDENGLQQQMLQFESMMSQMMAFKQQSAVMNDQQRKKKAQQLFSKMFKGMMNDQI